MKHKLSLLLSSLLLSVAHPVIAEPKPEDLQKAEELFNQAERLYKAGDFEKALADYKQAYFLTEFPDFLYNMAQCQKQLNNYDAALDLYRSYLRDVPDTELRASVEATIKELEALAKQQKEQKPNKVAGGNNLKELVPMLKTPAIFMGVWVGTGVTARVIANRIDTNNAASPGFYNTGRVFAISSDLSLIAAGVTTYLAISAFQKKQKEKVVSLAPVQQGAAVLFTYTPEAH